MRTFALFADLHGIPRGKLVNGPPDAVALAACRGVLAKDLHGRPVLFDTYARPVGASDVETTDAGGRTFPRRDGGVSSTDVPPLGADAIAIRSLVGDDGQAHPLDARARLSDHLGSNRLAASMCVGAELELSLLPAGDAPRPPIDGQAYASTGLAAREAYFADVLDALDAYGIDWLATSQENELDQYEISLAHTDPLTQADRVLLARLLCRAVAPRHGLVCTFAPVLDLARAPSSLHVHLSCPALEADGHAPAASALVSGPLAHLNELVAVLLPSALSRRVAGIDSFASTRLDHGPGDRFRTIRTFGGDGGGGPPASDPRVECRTPTAEANPYLVVLGLVGAVAAAAAAAERGEDPVVPDPETRIEYGLEDSLRRFETSELARALFGAPLVDHLVAVKRAEFEHAPGRDIGAESASLARVL